MNNNYYKISGRLSHTNNFILPPDLMSFLVTMERFSRDRRQELLLARERRQQEFDKGIYPNFLEDTAAIRQGNWRVDNTPPDLQDRRVEITGPVDRKMIINALNSGAKVFMADFEDSNSPTWNNCIDGQINLYDAVRKEITYTDPQSNKHYKLNEKTAVLIVRPRGWHLDEPHVLIDEKPMSASLFDALTYLYHNAKTLLEQGTGPYFYLPKMESHLEARLWNDVFLKAQELLDLPRGCVKVTVLIETITAGFEMDEIIYELRDHIVGLNCGRWDYIFSYIKKFRNHKEFLLPDRQQVTMTSHFLSSYVNLLIKTCHRRGVHAMGGMAAQIPIKGDEHANQEAMERVYADKRREALAGHDGTWVAHPGLIPIALKAFDELMPAANQLSKIPEVSIIAQDLLMVPPGTITETGVRNNITVGLLYVEAWLTGNGCVPIRNLMEDAATAEICRAQLWQWLKFSASLDTGVALTVPMLHQWFDEEYNMIMQGRGTDEGSSKALTDAKVLMEEMIFKETFDDFLTTKAYSHLI
ncbi:malate synthase A [Legionella rowbothamii]|uniref:malate synthase A n=1 Tax=Legionella rowbothamii TaxID=96229 RepID=UPI001A93B6BB|nr:malate synthase A [Legionella rowbothamii]